MNTQTRHSLMLMLCALIWGTAFVAQSAGSGMGAYSFLAGRSWLAVLVLLPLMPFAAAGANPPAGRRPLPTAKRWEQRALSVAPFCLRPARPSRSASR